MNIVHAHELDIHEDQIGTNMQKYIPYLPIFNLTVNFQELSEQWVAGCALSKTVDDELDYISSTKNLFSFIDFTH